MAAGGGGRAVRGIFFDFDSTISCAIRVGREWAVADKKEVFRSMTPEQIVANFGGSDRIAKLDALFGGLRQGGVEIFIVSIGYRAAFMPHLEHVGLLKHFPNSGEGCIFGQDSQELRRHRFVKAGLIGELMRARGWAPAEALFIDDSEEHVRICSEAGACQVMHVRNTRGSVGMTDEHMRAVFQAAGVQPPPALQPAQPPA
eukprot:TRINITY_DN56324_c0_g1_i1.p1 TRINITY_DN56324_c0_g1~~TRINITY_DN56324_c0_g1_i1.p1  ORF type:complete len:226 (+),score=77.41 TRINITY_DN56324_c0_g1_i1:77-679(+)